MRLLTRTDNSFAQVSAPPSAARDRAAKTQACRGWRHGLATAIFTSRKCEARRRSGRHGTRERLYLPRTQGELLERCHGLRKIVPNWAYARQPANTP